MVDRGRVYYRKMHLDTDVIAAQIGTAESLKVERELSALLDRHLREISCMNVKYYPECAKLDSNF